jgi:hypothetical protein
LFGAGEFPEALMPVSKVNKSVPMVVDDTFFYPVREPTLNSLTAMKFHFEHNSG